MHVFNEIVFIEAQSCSKFKNKLRSLASSGKKLRTTAEFLNKEEKIYCFIMIPKTFLLSRYLDQ